ncbi:hypothetical protein HMPREF3162_04590 [Brevibacterium sp. HMSC07C04]|nr:hypothetical protein HMPREF3162_04590 [Brevibacterium sp. HMSC07C04]
MSTLKGNVLEFCVPVWRQLTDGKPAEHVQLKGAHNSYRAGGGVTGNKTVYVAVIDFSAWSGEAVPASWVVKDEETLLEPIVPETSGPEPVGRAATHRSLLVG